MHDDQCDAINEKVSGLSLCITSSKPEIIPGYQFSCKPDCTVYNKDDNAEVKGIGTDFRLAEFFVEFKSSASCDPFIPETNTEDAGFDGSEKPECYLTNQTPQQMEVLGQLGTYAAIHLDSQYRTHSFLVLIVERYARLMRWDRSGAIFTERIQYSTQPELVQFFQHYHLASPEVRGSDSILKKLPHDEPIAAAARPALQTDATTRLSSSVYPMKLIGTSSHLLSFGLPFPWGVVRARQGLTMSK